MDVEFFRERILNPALSFPVPIRENASKLPFGTYFDILMDWPFPVFFSLGYVVLVTAWKSMLSQPYKTTSIPFKLFIIAHNLFLCVFSAVTFVSMAPRLFLSLTNRPFLDGWCDSNALLWNQGLGYWTWVFYLSKYYEVVDTLILLLKGRRASLLQSYHHTGAILCLWSATVSQGPAIWLFVVFNSFIHTLMYFYYALTTIGIKPPGKKHLTSMQITQFVVGGLLGFTYLFIPGCMRLVPGMEMYEYASHLFILAYLVPLTFLFLDFSKKAYGAKDLKKTKKKD